MAYLASQRGVANATLTDPGAEPPYTPSRRGTANVTVEAPAAVIPPGWSEIGVYQRVSSSWIPITLWQDGHRIRVIQFTQTPAAGYGRSRRGTANAVVGASWVKPKMGVIGGAEATFNTINNQVGQGVIRRTYNTTLPSSWAASNAASDVAAGRESYWSWKPSVTGFVGSSAQQAAFSDFLDTIPDGHKCVIMGYHEPEDNIEGGEFTLAQWGALQDTIATIVKSKNRPEMRTGFCLMGQYTFDARSGRVGWDWEGCLNWDLIDVVGIDPYRMIAGDTKSLETLLTVQNSGTGTGTAPSTMQVLQSWGKPIAIMEWGAWLSTDASVATYVTEGYAWMKRWNEAHRDTPIECAMWFNYQLSGNATLLNGPSVTAYAATVADSKIPV